MNVKFAWNLQRSGLFVYALELNDHEFFQLCDAPHENQENPCVCYILLFSCRWSAVTQTHFPASMQHCYSSVASGYSPADHKRMLIARVEDEYRKWRGQPTCGGDELMCLFCIYSFPPYIHIVLYILYPLLVVRCMWPYDWYM